VTGSRRPALVIFDLDGTLADTLPDIASALNTTLSGAGFSTLPNDTIVKFVGDGSEKLIERALPPGSDRATVATLLARFSSHYERHPCVLSELYPGVTVMLEGLTSAGVAIAVVTNKLGTVARRLLEALLPGGSWPFIRVIGDKDGFPRKPDPAAALALMAEAGAVPASTVVVGDGLPDMRMGRALGASALAAAWGYVPRELLAAEAPTWIAESPEHALGLMLQE